MKHCLVRVVHAALVAILLAAGAPAWAATTYCVATNGSDANSGTDWSQPFKTITNAVRLAQSGDTVLVTNGTYNYTTNANGINIMCLTNAITVRSVNGYKVTTLTPTWGYYQAPYASPVELYCEGAVLDGFKITGIGWEGGGVLIATGLVQNCWINGCSAYRAGGVKFAGAKDAATAYKATIRNCLITSNSVGDEGGGVWWGANYAGVVDSCTITKNSCGSNDGGGVKNLQTGGTILNSIVHGNTSSGSHQDFYWTASTANISNNCITKDYTSGGTGNITNDPSFVNLAGGDYHLNPSSPCRDKGSIQAWMAGTKDLDGIIARIMPVAGGTNDMGCFEFDTDALICSISATPLYGFPPLPVTFTSSVSGNTNGLFYRWDLRADGSFEVEGADKAGFTTNLDIGLYSIALTITNALGSSASSTNLNYVKVGPPTNYVDAAGANPVSPYTTWTTASTNIQKALDLGVPGTLTLVTNGIYNIGNLCVTNDAGVTLRSVNGYTHTTVEGVQPWNAASGIFRIDHASAVVDGFTIKGSMPYAPGVYVRNGLLQNCWITANYGYRPGGVDLYSGIVRNCLISDNLTSDGAGGVQFSSSTGLVENCTITRNNGGSSTGCGGVLNVFNGGIMRNTIVHSNTTTAGGPNQVQVLFVNKANIDHCCITTNYITGPTTSLLTTNDNISATGNTTNNPRFVDTPGGNYRLGQGSPCINTGTNQGWMVGAKDLDVNPRILHTVDMGVFEWVPSRGIIIMFR